MEEVKVSDNTADLLIIVVRHAERADHVDSEAGKAESETDFPITELGKQQAAHTGRVIRSILQQYSI